MKSYYKSEKSGLILEILILIASKNTGSSVSEIAHQTDMKEPTVRNYLDLLLSKNFIEKQGEKYIVGQQAALLWSKRVADLKGKRADINKDLEELGMQ